MVGEVSEEDFATLTTLLAEERFRSYEADALSEGSSVDLASERVLTVIPECCSSLSFVYDRARDANTTAMLDTLIEVQSRHHREGELFNKSDANLAEERNWPEP